MVRSAKIKTLLTPALWIALAILPACQKQDAATDNPRQPSNASLPSVFRNPDLEPGPIPPIALAPTANPLLTSAIALQNDTRTYIIGQAGAAQYDRGVREACAVFAGGATPVEMCGTVYDDGSFRFYLPAETKAGDVVTVWTNGPGYVDGGPDKNGIDVQVTVEGPRFPQQLAGDAGSFASSRLLAVDRVSGDLWASATEGLYRIRADELGLDPSNMRPEFLTVTQNLRRASIGGIYRDAAGGIWALEQGLSTAGPPVTVRARVSSVSGAAVIRTQAVISPALETVWSNQSFMPVERFGGGIWMVAEGRRQAWALSDAHPQIANDTPHGLFEGNPSENDWMRCNSPMSALTTFPMSALSTMRGTDSSILPDDPGDDGEVQPPSITLIRQVSPTRAIGVTSRKDVISWNIQGNDWLFEKCAPLPDLGPVTDVSEIETLGSDVFLATTSGLVRCTGLASDGIATPECAKMWPANGTTIVPTLVRDPNGDRIYFGTYTANPESILTAGITLDEIGTPIVTVEPTSICPAVEKGFNNCFPVFSSAWASGDTLLLGTAVGLFRARRAEAGPSWEVTPVKPDVNLNFGINHLLLSANASGEPELWIGSENPAVAVLSLKNPDQRNLEGFSWPDGTRTTGMSDFAPASFGNQRGVWVIGSKGTMLILRSPDGSVRREFVKNVSCGLLAADGRSGAWCYREGFYLAHLGFDAAGAVTVEDLSAERALLPNAASLLPEYRYQPVPQFFHMVANARGDLWLFDQWLVYVRKADASNSDRWHAAVLTSHYSPEALKPFLPEGEDAVVELGGDGNLWRLRPLEDGTISQEMLFSPPKYGARGPSDVAADGTGGYWIAYRPDTVGGVPIVAQIPKLGTAGSPDAYGMKLRSVFQPGQFPGSFISAMASDPVEGGLWISTENGLARAPKESFVDLTRIFLQ
ncbi:MAG: hypothetical protein V1798_08190 [Pseudomonadota bacterium]